MPMTLMSGEELAVMPLTHKMFCMYCAGEMEVYGMHKNIAYKCKHCRTHCNFCNKQIRGDQPDALGSCRTCWIERIKYFTHQFGSRISIFDARLRKKRLGTHQQIIADKLLKHFNIKICYKISNFRVDLYFEDLGLYVIFKNREFINRKTNKFGISKEMFIKQMVEYENAFKSTGHELTYVFVDELIYKDEEELVRYFSELSKSHKKMKGEFLI